MEKNKCCVAILSTENKEDRFIECETMDKGNYWFGKENKKAKGSKVYLLREGYEEKIKDKDFIETLRKGELDELIEKGYIEFVDDCDQFIKGGDSVCGESKLEVKQMGVNSNLFDKEVEDTKALWVKDGYPTDGYAWAGMYLHIFIEFVFTMRGVPSQIELDVPNGKFILTAVLNKDNEPIWIVENTAYNTKNFVNVHALMGYYIKEAKGHMVGSEEYIAISAQLLTLGLTDEDREKVIKEIFPKMALV